jgi:hypothetical protein
MLMLVKWGSTGETERGNKSNNSEETKIEREREKETVREAKRSVGYRMIKRRETKNKNTISSNQIQVWTLYIIKSNQTY